MKHAPLYLLCLIAAVALTACQKKDDPVDDDNTPENPQQTIPQQDLETDEVDPSVYKYPAEGDFMNPNLILIPDYDKVTLTAIDTLAHTATLDFAGLPVRLVDTAGLRNSADPVERLGIQRSREQLEDADLVLLVVDGALHADPEAYLQGKFARGVLQAAGG